MFCSLQYYSTDAFSGGGSIDSPYVEGLSITYGSPRKHIWTFAVGLSQDYNYPNYNCPCAQYPGPSPPSFVGNDYYCESGMKGHHQKNNCWSSERLWDGHCHTKSKCCDRWYAIFHEKLAAHFNWSFRGSVLFRSGDGQWKFWGRENGTVCPLVTSYEDYSLCFEMLFLFSCLIWYWPMCICNSVPWPWTYYKVKLFYVLNRAYYLLLKWAFSNRYSITLKMFAYLLTVRNNAARILLQPLSQDAVLVVMCALCEIYS